MDNGQWTADSGCDINTSRTIGCDYLTDKMSKISRFFPGQYGSTQIA
jgi:hypothetical protein